MMLENNFALMDIEYIQTSKTHRCIRKLCILGKDGFTDLEKEFYPCTEYNYLEEQDKVSFDWCRKRIHKLNYYPKRWSPECRRVTSIVRNFITTNNFKFILFKGGTIERDLCNTIDIPAYNIECLNIEKAKCHNPKVEIEHYFGQLLKAGYIIPIPHRKV